MSAEARVSVRVGVGCEAAFDAFTTDLAAWWRPHPLFATSPRAPGVLALVKPGPDGRLVETLADGRSFEVGRVLAWEPPKRLLLGWRPVTLAPDQATEIEVRFEAVGDQTRVSVSHRGWERVPEGHVARHGFPEPALLHRAGDWWAGQLGRYKHLFAPVRP